MRGHRGLEGLVESGPEASAPRFFLGASETRARLWAVMAMLAAAAFAGDRSIKPQITMAR